MDKIQEQIGQLKSKWRMSKDIYQPELNSTIDGIVSDLTELEQQLQTEQQVLSKMETADIDKIMEEADRLSNVGAIDYWINIPRNRLREIITKHLTQKTTVPKDGEVVEIKKDKELGYGKCNICGCGNDFLNIYCNGCLKEIIRID